jgi:ubiquinone/menaquinone biosynthesis C-methylase UbiE
LDVGGGSGAFTARFAGSSQVLTVLDPDARAVRIGARRHPTFRFVLGQGEQLPFPSSGLDRIVAIRSTHHMQAPGRFFSEAHRVLAERGRIVIEELTRASMLAKLFSALLRCRHRHPERLDFRTAADWQRGLTDAGFDEVRVEGEGRWFFVSGRKRGSSRDSSQSGDSRESRPD